MPPSGHRAELRMVPRVAKQTGRHPDEQDLIHPLITPDRVARAARRAALAVVFSQELSARSVNFGPAYKDG